MGIVRIVNVPDISPGDAFVDLPVPSGDAIEWCGHSGLPRNSLERMVTRPRLSRYRAAWSAVGDATAPAILISHLPRMTAAVEQVARLRRMRAPHLAFSFNFTDLPEGARRSQMAQAFQRVERFCVYSRYEADLYPKYFGLPADRFEQVMWGQEAPLTDRTHPAPEEPFVVAIGGEGRDYAAMVAAARARPDVRWIVIARPSNAFDAAPANLTVKFNVPAPLTWGLAERAASVVVPLRSATTCCGHITIASAQLLGLPLITTRSEATEEYVAGMRGTTVVEPGDGLALAVAAAEAVSDPLHRRETAAPDRAMAERRYDRAQWTTYISRFIDGFAR